MSDIEIARDDLALDALGAGLAAGGYDRVLGLLAAFRADLEPPAPNVVPLRRKRRAGALVGLSAAAGLILGGLTAGAVVSADQPGEFLYAAHKAVLGDPRAADRVAKLLDDAAEKIAKGDLRGARDRIGKAAERLADVDDPAERALLAARIERLRALALDPVPTATPSRDDDASETPEPAETSEPRETSSPGDDSGPGSDDSGSGSSGSGSGSDSSGSGSGSDDSGSGSGSDSGGHGGGDDG